MVKPNFARNFNFQFSPDCEGREKMASQAVRLNLRMQKEIKLLLSDPPIGVSFPRLTSAFSTDATLSTIDAELQGPEETVYAGGKFQIKIQIPERYPLQPPIVTFVTPVYHPNIDNGGRICLDILNLPPKGAWQPSLNISTVLMSIGLLLSEPNPDDGLMCEASREYKYNRQTFVQKARIMTEKYAKPGSCGSSCFSSSNQQALILGTMKRKQVDGNTRYEDSTDSLGHEKSSSTCSMPSLESSGSLTERNDEERVSETPEMMDVVGSCKTTEAETDSVDRNLRNSKLSLSKRGLSPSCSDPSRKKGHIKNLNNFLLDSFLVVDSDDHGKEFQVKLVEETTAGNPCQAINYQEPKSPSSNQTTNHHKMSMVQKPSSLSNPGALDVTTKSAHIIHQGAIKCDKHESDINAIEKECMITTDVKSKRFFTSRNLALGFTASPCRHTEDEKENAGPAQGPNFQLLNGLEPLPMVSSNPSTSACLNHSVGNRKSNSKREKYRIDKRFRKKLTEELCCSSDHKCSALESPQSKSDEADLNMPWSAEVTPSEAFIVLDSEDSDEERSDHKKFELSLTKKHLVGK